MRFPLLPKRHHFDIPSTDKKIGINSPANNQRWRSDFLDRSLMWRIAGFHFRIDSCVLILFCIYSLLFSDYAPFLSSQDTRRMAFVLSICFCCSLNHVYKAECLSGQEEVDLGCWTALGASGLWIMKVLILQTQHCDLLIVEKWHGTLEI